MLASHYLIIAKVKIGVPNLVGLRQKLPVNRLRYSFFNKLDILKMPES